MSNATVTRESVFAAADALQAAGEKTTLVAVRKRLGGGSYSTITEHMAEWKKQQTAKAAEGAEPPPQALADKLAVFGADVWKQALDLANGRLSAERATLDDDRRTLESERMEAVALADQKEAEADDLRIRLAESQAEVRALTTALAERGNEVAHLEASAAASKAQTAALLDAINRAEAEISEAKRQSTAAIEEASTLRGQLIALQQQAAEERQRADQAQTQAADHRSRAERAEQARDIAERDAGRAQEERDAARHELTTMTAKAASAANEAAAARGELQGLIAGQKGATTQLRKGKTAPK